MAEPAVTPSSIEAAKKALIEVMEIRDNGVSFVELIRCSPSLAGTLTCVMKDNENVILWNGLSRACIRALGALLDKDVISYEVCAAMLYELDGVKVPLPVAKNTTHPHKSEHWLPVVFNRGSKYSENASSIPAAILHLTQKYFS